MARYLARLGGLLLVAGLVYLAIWEIWRGGANAAVFRRFMVAGMVGLGLAGALWALGAGVAGIAGRGCPRCGRRVGSGRIYCDEHRQETINEYRDRQRGQGG